jgi:hypothetical protein
MLRNARNTPALPVQVTGAAAWVEFGFERGEHGGMLPPRARESEDCLLWRKGAQLLH